MTSCAEEHHGVTSVDEYQSDTHLQETQASHQAVGKAGKGEPEMCACDRVETKNSDRGVSGDRAVRGVAGCVPG